MNRAPHICVAGRFLPLKATELHHASNDRARIMASVSKTNDNDLRGRPCA